MTSRKECEPQRFGIGVKEVWEVPDDTHDRGKIIHTLGWPMEDTSTWAGSFIYHMDGNKVGMDVGKRC